MYIEQKQEQKLRRGTLERHIKSRVFNEGHAFHKTDQNKKYLSLLIYY